MPAEPTQSALQAIAESGRLFQAKDVPGPPDALAHAARRGALYRVIPGVYVGAEHPHHPLIEAAAWTLRHPRAVTGLFTAAVFHDLTTAFERGTWLLIPKRASVPRSQTREVHVIQAAPSLVDPAADADLGIDTVRVHEVSVRMTNPDRTVLDLMRYPHSISIEHSLEALRRRSLADDFRVPTFARLARRLGVWGRIEQLVQGLALR